MYGFGGPGWGAGGGARRARGAAPSPVRLPGSPDGQSNRLMDTRGPHSPCTLRVEHAVKLLPARADYAARTRLRISPARFSRTRPNAMASITTNARPIRSRIFANPRMK